MLLHMIEESVTTTCLFALLRKINTKRSELLKFNQWKKWRIGTHDLPVSGNPWCFVIVELETGSTMAREITLTMNKNETEIFLRGALLAVDPSAV